MAKTLVQRLARERQKATGDKYSISLRYVQEHLDELAPEFLRRRADARIVRSAQASSDVTNDADPLCVDDLVVDQPSRRFTAVPASASLAVVFSAADRSPAQ